MTHIQSTDDLPVNEIDCQGESLIGMRTSWNAGRSPAGTDETVLKPPIYIRPVLTLCIKKIQLKSIAITMALRDVKGRR